MSDYFPQEVLIEILSRVPVNSLLRFRCVSKSWLSLITSPNFINTHVNQSNNNNSHLLIRYFSLNPSSQERYSVHFDTQTTLDHYTEFNCPFKTRSKTFFRLVGTCNGLICLSDDQFGYTYTLIIWNPAIRRCVSLPRPRVCFDVYGPYMFALGFGIDSRTNDHKLVRLAWLQNRVGSWDTSKGVTRLLYAGGEEGYLPPPEVEVFSLSTGSWKTVNADAPPYKMIDHFCSAVFLKGSLHWLAHKRMDDSNRSYHSAILAFDIGREVFDDMILPKRLASKFPLNLTIGMFEETLAVFHYDDWNLTKRCAVWVMEQFGVAESWRKQFTVEIQEGIGAALGFRKNGEMILVKGNDEVVLYDPGSKAFNSLGIHSNRDSVFVGTYAESLVLLDGVNVVLGAQVESCSTINSEEEAVSGSQDEATRLADALQQNSMMNRFFAVHFLSY
ncbi:F-box protein CPR1-like [Cornus florida]|uniref:F-box protein CPR1-like n=1 Tax=Cornus florida TaxID=4283 RepID=UPI0028A0A119|nr:F-box protein CPR1-like [Cornus florida]